MLQRVVRIVGEVVQPVVVAAQVGQELPPLPQSITLVCDRRPNHGPLEGLAVALAALQGRANATFVTGCDTPLLPPRFVRRMSELLGDFDAVVPCIDGVDQPLLAVYRTSILPRVEQLAGADSRLIALFNRLNSRRVAADLLTDVDPPWRLVDSRQHARRLSTVIGPGGTCSQREKCERQVYGWRHLEGGSKKKSR